MRKAHAAAAAAFVACALQAMDVLAADPLPYKTIRIVAPNPPGGATDVLSRMIATPLQLRTGVPVIVENKGGASTNIGNESSSARRPTAARCCSATSRWR
jgi:tripartite-type tricarboxylate transporter receptor subunit TctC